MPVVVLRRAIALRMDAGRIFMPLAPGRHTVTQDAAERIAAAGAGEIVVRRGERFAALPDAASGRASSGASAQEKRPAASGRASSGARAQEPPQPQTEGSAAKSKGRTKP